jgi:pyruvate/2-oxoglutarate dehydrogenase complex dihydrolipoamide dehydrogenase (E3) component
VTVVEKFDRILQKEDEDVVFLLQRGSSSPKASNFARTKITSVEPRRAAAR